MLAAMTAAPFGAFWYNKQFFCETLARLKLGYVALKVTKLYPLKILNLVFEEDLSA